ncbi:MAG TPA: hypothetical protein VIX37_13670 [Candidatus Sulfotelmatobacter sp.]
MKLESEPSSKELLASVFRTIHSIQGSCGFLGLAWLEKWHTRAKACSPGCATASSA